MKSQPAKNANDVDDNDYEIDDNDMILMMNVFDQIHVNLRDLISSKVNLYESVQDFGMGKISSRSTSPNSWDLYFESHD